MGCLTCVVSLPTAWRHLTAHAVSGLAIKAARAITAATPNCFGT